MVGALERALGDEALAMHVQRPRSREYLWNHLQIGGYKIKIEEISCNSL